MAMKKFNVGVKAVIIKDDKVLVVKTNYGDNFWEVPGGRIDNDETIMETLDRELHEELPNIQNIKVGELVYAHRVDHDIAEDLGLVLLFFRVEAGFTDDKPTLSDEHLDWKWATKEDALSRTIDGSQQGIKAAFAK